MLSATPAWIHFSRSRSCSSSSSARSSRDTAGRRPASLIAAIAATVLATWIPAAASNSGGIDSTPPLALRQVEAAFYRAGLPFQRDWSPHSANPYLVPGDNPRSGIPATFRAHLIGWADGTNSSSFQIWQVFVFDSDAKAASFARTFCKPASCTGLVSIRSDNVAYVGSRIPAALRAMARLRRR